MLSQRKQFQTILRHDDPIVRDHTVHGVRIMPGVTFIDVVVRTLAAVGISAFDCELRKILFHETVAVAPGMDREVRISIEPGQRAAKVSVESRGLAETGPLSDAFSLNISCEVASRSAAQNSHVDLEALRAGSEEVVDVDAIYAIARAMRIEHGPFMKTSGRVYRGADYVLAEVSLSDVARAHAEDFVFHPALMDAATLPYAALLYGTHEDIFKSPFIPIYVENFRAMQGLGSSLSVLVRRGPDTRALEDVLYNDIEVFDADGMAIARFGRLGAKRIRSPELITRSLGSGERSARVGAKAPEPSAMAAEMIETSGADSVSRALCVMVGAMLGRPAIEVDAEVGFYDLGLESTDLLKLVQQLEQRTSRELYPTLLFEYSSIQKLADYLTGEGMADWALAGSARAESVPLSGPTGEPAHEPGLSRAGEATPEVLVPSWEAQDAWRPDPAAGGQLVLVADAATLATASEAFVGYDLIKIELGCGYLERAERDYVVDRSARDDYRRALDAIAERGVTPVAIVHAPNAERAVVEPEDTDPVGAVARAYERELFGIETAHALIGAAIGSSGGRVPLVHLARGADAASGAAVAAILRCVALEAPELSAKVLYIEPELAWRGALGQCVGSELARGMRRGEFEVRYSERERAVRQLGAPLASERQNSAMQPRQGGVYVISGGGGGLGLLLAQNWIARYDARLLLIGRSPLSDEKAGRLQELRDKGGRVSYLQADITKLDEVKRALRLAKQRLGQINGVVHCAGVTCDATLRTQTFAETEAVWSTKVLGALVLDAATKHEDLDFFLLFSSLSALTGNIGQSAYAGANAWLDAWADERARAVQAGTRSGRSLSIDWPLWSVGGLHPGRALADAMRRSFGLLELEAEEGMNAIDACFDTRGAQAVVFKGSDADVRSALIQLAPPVPSHASRTRAALVEAKAPAAAAGPAPMAIIGISGRYPQAPDLATFWQNLCAGRDSITQIPGARWNVEQHFDARRNTPGKSYSKWGGFLDGVDQFDPLFFNIGPHEAVAMDPQERLFLECAWSTLEDAGYTRSLAQDPLASRERRVGVFVGAMWHEYQMLALEETLRGNPVSANASAASIANRVSYCLDLHGPSVPVDTMCSSSLMAIHLACESIRSGESSLALAGGVNLMLHPSKYTKLCQMQMLSSDGRCRSFGEGGDGYVPGEGVGCVLIKPLDRAIADGDHVYAVIRGTHVNHGGKSGGMTVPSPAAQAELISRGLAKARVTADSISYIEAHGTGTALGDPIEIAGLQRALAEDGRSPGRCPIGSVKSNIGHLEAAAGIAAVTKVILQLQHRTLVPSLHATEVNKSIDFAATPFVVQQTTEPWLRPTLPSGEAPLRASISSFGAGGVNVHMILEECPAPTGSGPAIAEPQLVLLSAKKEAQLQAHAQQLLSFTQSADGAQPARFSDVAHTLATGREPFRHRLALLASNYAELGAALQGYLDEQALPGVFVGDAKLGSGRAQSGVLRRGVARASGTRLEQQAVSWVLGTIDQLPANELRGRARRVPLPTYPFERKRYWICEDHGGARPALSASSSPSAFEPEPGSAVLRLRGSTERRLVKLLASEINLAEAEIEADEPFESYGVDSVVGARLLSRMEQAYGQLPVALLLERRSIRDVVSYLVEHCRERLTHHDSDSIREDGLTTQLAVANM